MKKIIYSTYTKITAVVLILSLAFLGFYQLADVILPKHYSIGDYHPSQYDREITYQIKYTFNTIFESLNIVTRCTNVGGSPLNNGNTENTALTPIVPNIEYYAVYEGQTITNMNAAKQERIKNLLSLGNSTSFMNYLKNGGVVLENTADNLSIRHNYNFPFYFSENIGTPPYTIFVSPSENYFSEMRQNKLDAEVALQALANEITQHIEEILWLAIGMLILSAYLVWVCGKSKNNSEIRMQLIDRFWIEIMLGISAIAVILLMMVMVAFSDSIYYDGRNSLYSNCFALSGAVACGIILTALLSAIRNLKNRSFAKRSLILSASAWIWQQLQLAYIRIKKALGVKSYTLAAAVILAYGILMIVFHNATIMILLTIAMISLALKAIIGFDDLRKGIFELCQGNIDYKINTTDTGIIADLCDSVDHIGDGISAAVEKQLSAERMKSQLITNVSHDLKTPLTAIINYAELLCKTELTPDKANEYAEIIHTKSLRLKTLTSDLFDISKVQSGNETIELDNIDITLLINQTLGELDEEIKKSGFEVNTALPESCIIKGDGAKLSRVFENLLVNALKYSLKGTRIYITASADNEQVKVEIKNISAYPLDFDANEITERFMRGDSSRSTEGNGLGLAIAKSYTEAMGGNFRIVTDGDLFKAVLSF